MSLTGRTGPAKRLLAAAGLILAIASACAHGRPAFPAAAPPSDGIPRSQATADPPSRPDFEVSISYVANLVHWIDNLAGSSQGKTIRVYRQYWARRFGMPTPAEMDLLRDWVEIRWKDVPRPDAKILNASGCLPQAEDAPDWRRTFRIRSYDAPSIEAFVASMSGNLTTEETAALSRVLDTFRPRFDEAWADMTFLSYFKERFETFLKESDLRAYLGEVAAFFGVDPAAHPPGRIHLMALPEEGATHAQADGRDLLMEIRPNDTPIEQIQVIAHETSHYMWSLVPPERNDSFALQVHAAGVRGPVVWNLLREGLPTALGQGLAEARLAPHRFGERYTWYHIDVVDRFAKEIYPIVAEAFEDGKRVEEGLLAEIFRKTESGLDLARTRPSDYLTQSFFAVGEGMWAAYAEIRRSARVHFGWPYDLKDPEGAAFASRYECLSGVVLLGPEEMKDPARLPEISRPPSRGDAASRSFIQAVRRPAGGTIFYLVAATPEDAPRMGRAFLDLTAWPGEPAYLDGAATSSSLRPPPPEARVEGSGSRPRANPAPSP